MFKRISGILIALLIILGLPCEAAPKPTEESGEIAALVAKLFEGAHFSHHKLDQELAAKFLTKYMESLDYNHLFFLQTDQKEFEKFRATLDEKTRIGDIRPAFEIFARYQQRVEQSVAAMKRFLQEPMDFSSQEKILLDRSKAAWPANEAEAETLLRQRAKYDLLQEDLNKTKPDEALKVVTRRYERLLRSMHEMDADDVLEVYLNALCHAYDPHSDYMGASELKNFEIGLKLSLFGIGAVLQSQDGYAKIVSLIPGGPADMDKRLKPNDRVVAVAEGDQPPVDVLDLKLNKVVQLIRGAKGTKVKLTVIPAAAADSSVRKVITLVRDEVKLTEQHAKAKLIEFPCKAGIKRLGVIDLPSFYADTDKQRSTDSEPTSSARDVAELLQKLQSEKVDGVVIDLRRNGGGLLEEAVALAGLFIKEGPVVQVKDSRHHIQILRDEDPKVCYSGPLIVLTSHISASASEIFAAAMQDYGRALIVGDSKTFGKGTVQTMVSLGSWLSHVPNPGAVKLTTQKFYRVAGGSTQNRGVIPDVVLPSLFDCREIGESSLDNALPYDEVKPVEHQNLSLIADKLVELRKRSTDRISTDRAFAHLNAYIVRLTQWLKETAISLNKEERQKEKKADTDRLAAWKKERLTLNEPKLKITELALQSLPQPAATPAAKPVEPPAAAPADPESDEEPVDANDKDTPASDPVFNETLAILNDLVDLTKSAAAVTASTQPNQ